MASIAVITSLRSPAFRRQPWPQSVGIIPSGRSPRRTEHSGTGRRPGILCADVPAISGALIAAAERAPDCRALAFTCGAPRASHDWQEDYTALVDAPRRHVIIGNGIAGTTAAETLRR